jgi:hypothetical protein
VTTVPRTIHQPRDLSPSLAPSITPYAEQQEWTELWEACVTVLDRYPHIRPPSPAATPVLRHVRIPQSAVDAADVHYHLD